MYSNSKILYCEIYNLNHVHNYRMSHSAIVQFNIISLNYQVIIGNEINRKNVKFIKLIINQSY